MTIEFCLTEFSATKIVTWKCHVDESTNRRYDIIIGRDLLTTLGLDLKFSKNIIIGVEIPYKGCLSPMVDLRNYAFTHITDKTVKLEEPFINSYVNECLEYDSAISLTSQVRIILYNKYKIPT